MQNTTLYLIRHSIKYDIKDIVENYNTSDSEQIKNEKLILSIEGERRAEILSNEKELQNIDIVETVFEYASKFDIDEKELRKKLENKINEATNFKNIEKDNARKVYKSFIDSHNSRFNKATNLFK